MHHRILASETIIPSSPVSSSDSRAFALVSLVYRLSRALDISPQLYTVEAEQTVWLLWERSAFDCYRLIEEYGPAIAWISEQFPLSLYGTTEVSESADCTIQSAGPDRLVCRKFTISGQDFAVLSDLCLRLSIQDDAVRHPMAEILRCVDPYHSWVAVRRTPLAENWFAGIREPDSRTFFRFLPLEDPLPVEEIGSFPTFWQALTLEQQQLLWLLLLRDGASAAEMDYVIAYWQEGWTFSPCKWELSLRRALAEAGVSIHYDADDFRMTNAAGRRIRYDYTSGTGAQRLCLKLLFPVAPERDT